jgi:hypothetical protein
MFSAFARRRIKIEEIVQIRNTRENISMFLQQLKLYHKPTKAR